MALFQAHFCSGVLNLCCVADVILPDCRKDPARPLATLWLLHGLSDDHSIWQRRTSIERYAAAYRLAVVMPCVHRSWYADMANGQRYWQFVSEEMPMLMRQYFPLSEKREENFVAGLSMGGYGAFKLALNHPDRFAAAASLSGALDLVQLWEKAEGKGTLAETFNGSMKGTMNDLMHQASELVRSGAPRPRLYQWCGTEDFLYQDNQSFRNHAQAIGLDVAYSEGPGGHTWDRWDEQIQKVLAWISPEPA